MSDPVDPDALAEALEHGIDSPDAVERNIAYAKVFAAARAVLEAPTAEWCETHDEPKLMGHGGSAHVEDDTCTFGRVRLVAERSQE